MTLAFRTVNFALKGLTSLLCRIETHPLQQVPSYGPLILVCNHINFIEVPLVYSHLQPRPLTGFAKAETWDSPVLGPLFDLWGAIPLRRGQPDFEALQKGLKALAQGKIVAITPEGTRSGTGRMQRGHPGIVTLALHSGAPLLPLVYFGGESIHQNLRRLKRTDFHIQVGQPFRIETHGEKMTRQLRQQITDEIMCQLAALLPPAYRGYYADPNSYVPVHLAFEEAL